MKMKLKNATQKLKLINAFKKSNKVPKEANEIAKIGSEGILNLTRNIILNLYANEIAVMDIQDYFIENEDLRT